MSLPSSPRENPAFVVVAVCLEHWLVVVVHLEKRALTVVVVVHLENPALTVVVVVAGRD